MVLRTRSNVLTFELLVRAVRRVANVLEPLLLRVQVLLELSAEVRKVCAQTETRRKEEKKRDGRKLHKLVASSVVCVQSIAHSQHISLRKPRHGYCSRL